MKNSELKERIIILEAELEDVKSQMRQMAENSYAEGDHLRDDPFIPEYLGFTETVVTGEFGTTEARIYTKNGWNIARPIGSSAPRWSILAPEEKVPVKLFIKNMYNAIVVLAAAGMEISLEDYFMENRRMEENIMAGINDGLASLREEATPPA